MGTTFSDLNAGQFLRVFREQALRKVSKLAFCSPCLFVLVSRKDQPMSFFIGSRFDWIHLPISKIRPYQDGDIHPVTCSTSLPFELHFQPVHCSVENGATCVVSDSILFRKITVVH